MNVRHPLARDPAATRRLLATGCLAGCLIATPAGAADLGVAASEPPAPMTTPSPDWVVQISPYVWAAGMKGQVSPFRRAPTLEVDKSFSDVLEDLKGGGFINLWARRGNFVASADVTYVDLGQSEAIGALPVIGPTPGLSATVSGQMFMATLAGGYRLLEGPQGSFDLTAGARIWNISTTATLHYLGLSLGYGESFGWVDPLVGVRGFYNFTDRLSAMVQADVGGFGAGADSTWQVLATVNYAFSDNWSASLGYKVLDVDYAQGGHVFDTRLSGPVLGVTFRF